MLHYVIRLVVIVFCFLKKLKTGGERFYPKALYSMLHYLIHTCSWSQLRTVCERDLQSTISRELAQGLETGLVRY
jgi:hypothetical protein